MHTSLYCFITHIVRSGVLASALLFVSACTPLVDNRGHVADTPIAEVVGVGESKAAVRAKLGSPSSISDFGEENWYYIRNRRETIAFLEPEIVEQHVTRIVFDSNGNVAEVKHYDLNDREQFAYVDKTTPTEGHSLGFFEQILGNVGRFNAPTQ